MSKAFLMTSDVLIAYLIISFAMLLLYYLPQEQDYSYVYLKEITNDVGALVEYNISDVEKIINMTSQQLCFSVKINNTYYTKYGCNQYWSGESAVAIKTYKDSIIIVKGWYK